MAVLLRPALELGLVPHGPAVGAVEALRPPPVEDGRVEPAVQGRLHAARAAGLVGADRVVEPHVAAAREHAAHLHVVLLDERHAPLEAGLAGVLVDDAREFLPALVAGVRLAGEDDLHRALGVSEERGETLRLLEDQRRTLVGGEAAREAEGERALVEGAPGLAGVLAAALDRRARRSRTK